MRDRPDQTAMLASVPIPTLILTGAGDAIIPVDVATAMHQAIPRSTLEVVNDAGHMTPMEQPQRVTEVIRQFLSSLNDAG